MKCRGTNVVDRNTLIQYSTFNTYYCTVFLNKIMISYQVLTLVVSSLTSNTHTLSHPWLMLCQLTFVRSRRFLPFIQRFGLHLHIKNLNFSLYASIT